MKIKKTVNFAPALMMAVVFLNCAPAKFSRANSGSLMNAPAQLNSGCANDSFTEFVDQSSSGSVVYSEVEIDAQGSGQQSHIYRFEALPAPDFIASDFTIPFGGSAIPGNEISSILNRLGISSSAQKLSYCQARSICAAAFKEHSDWTIFNCSLSQLEFDSGGYVHEDGTNPGGHLLTYKSLIFFHGAVVDPFIVTDGSDTVQANGIVDNGILVTEKTVAATTGSVFTDMVSSGDLVFEH